ncbi:polyketide synthase [Fusarium beomiforme]|uniref:Polyketide synthase n=1 Tax=Fusarium beomiforme TaxID=44412 RepID=A0A9P5B032_9HYPO|nr:polyketide synthase [Fusarium beomiforme]
MCPPVKCSKSIPKFIHLRSGQCDRHFGSTCNVQPEWILQPLLVQVTLHKTTWSVVETAKGIRWIPGCGFEDQDLRSLASSPQPGHEDHEDHEDHNTIDALSLSGSDDNKADIDRGLLPDTRENENPLLPPGVIGQNVECLETVEFDSIQETYYTASDIAEQERWLKEATGLPEDLRPELLNYNTTDLLPCHNNRNGKETLVLNISTGSIWDDMESTKLKTVVTQHPCGVEIVWTENVMIPGNLESIKKCLRNQLEEGDFRIIPRSHLTTLSHLSNITEGNPGSAKYVLVLITTLSTPLATHVGAKVPGRDDKHSQEIPGPPPHDAVLLNIALAAIVIYVDPEKFKGQKEGFCGSDTELELEVPLGVFICYFPHILVPSMMRGDLSDVLSTFKVLGKMMEDIDGDSAASVRNGIAKAWVKLAVNFNRAVSDHQNANTTSLPAVLAAPFVDVYNPTVDESCSQNGEEVTGDGRFRLNQNLKETQSYGEGQHQFLKEISFNLKNAGIHERNVPRIIQSVPIKDHKIPNKVLYTEIGSISQAVSPTHRVDLVPVSMPGTQMVFPKDADEAKPTIGNFSSFQLNGIRTLGLPAYHYGKLLKTGACRPQDGSPGHDDEAILKKLASGSQRRRPTIRCAIHGVPIDSFTDICVPDFKMPTYDAGTFAFPYSVREPAHGEGEIRAKLLNVFGTVGPDEVIGWVQLKEFRDFTPE